MISRNNCQEWATSYWARYEDCTRKHVGEEPKKQGAGKPHKSTYKYPAQDGNLTPSPMTICIDSGIEEANSKTRQGSQLAFAIRLSSQMSTSKISTIAGFMLSTN